MKILVILENFIKLRFQAQVNVFCNTPGDISGNNSDDRMFQLDLLKVLGQQRNHFR